MSLPNEVISALLGGSAAGGGYQISRSVRLNSADSAYLSRTPGSASNRKTWTWAGWVKGVVTSENPHLFTCTTGATDATYFRLWFVSDSIRVSNYNNTLRQTSAVYRDPSAWYHIVLAVDTTQATAANRIKLYVNGSEVTTFSSSVDPNQNDDLGINQAAAHSIGATSAGTATLSGYLADIHFIEQALDPSSFGEFDTNGVWQPKAYSGSYLGNSFHLDFADNSTAAALGTDTSGNGNTFTVNNISVIQGNGNYLNGTITGSAFSSMYSWSKAFNGSLASYGAQSNGGLTYMLTFLTALTGTDIYIYTDQTGSNTNNAFAFNGITATTANTTQQAGSGPYKYKLDGISSLASVTTATVANFLGIEIDGVLLIDNSYSIGNDSLVDSPTNYGEDTGVGGEVVGNYCTLNPLINLANNTLANGNLDATHAASSWNSSNVQGNLYATFVGTLGVSSGKWYWEIITTSAITGSIGVTNTPMGGQYYVGAPGNGIGYVTETIYQDSAFGSTVSSLPSYAQNDVIGVALDLDNGKIFFSVNGTYINSADPVAGTGSLSSDVFGTFYPAVSQLGSTQGITKVANFGQRPWAYAAPANFKALCTTNLPAPTIENPSTVMDIKLYTGNNSTQTISGLNFSPDWVWIKSRSAGTDHALYDVVRGTQARLESNTTGDEATSDSGLTAFNSDGFALSTLAQVNTSLATYVAWAWDGGTSTVTNTSGSITSQVRANASAGFSIITFTMPAVATATIGHGLNVAPALYFWKDRDSADSWYTYHSSLGAGKYLTLNGTGIPINNTNIWNNTDPTSSVINTGNTFSTTGSTVVYAFAPVAGYSAFGSYTGNGSTDGPFVYTGFSPSFVIVKRTDSSGYSWIIKDNKRPGYNSAIEYLSANSDGAAGSGFGFDFTSNGFKLRVANGNLNASGATYLWAAFAESPFQYARAR